jgi:hypothetical protein
MIARSRPAAGAALLAVSLAAATATAGAPSRPAAASIPRGAGAAQVVAGGALDTDCSHVAGGLGGPGYQFIVDCPGRAHSPDRQFAVVQKGGAPRGEEVAVFLADPAGRRLDDIAGLADGMPFVLFWSPRSTWFFANHYLGSGLERLRVFEIVNRTAVERSGAFAEATRAMVRRYPCLGRTATVHASGWKWSRDGRRIAMSEFWESPSHRPTPPPRRPE